MSEGIALSDDTYGRIERVVRAYESSQGGPRPSLAGQATTHVRCTSSTATDGLYPGIVTSYSVDDELWSDVDGADVVMLDLNGNALAADTRYECVPVGVTEDGETVMLVIARAYPDATPTIAQGVVTNAAQSFGGLKRFQDGMAVFGTASAGSFVTYPIAAGAEFGIAEALAVTPTLYVYWAVTPLIGGHPGFAHAVLGIGTTPRYAVGTVGGTIYYGETTTLADGSEVVGGIIVGVPTSAAFITGGSGGSSGLTLGGTPTLTLGGTLNAASGGTGVDGSSAGAGYLLVGNGSGYTLTNVISGGTW